MMDRPYAIEYIVDKKQMRLHFHGSDDVLVTGEMIARKISEKARAVASSNPKAIEKKVKDMKNHHKDAIEKSNMTKDQKADDIAILSTEKWNNWAHNTILDGIAREAVASELEAECARAFQIDIDKLVEMVVTYGN